MQRATESEIDLFRAFLVEDDEGVAALMAEILGIDDEVIDLDAEAARKTETAPAH